MQVIIRDNVDYTKTSLDQLADLDAELETGRPHAHRATPEP